MFTALFWKDTAERAISTGAQAVLTVLSLDGVNFIVADADFKTLASAFGFGVLYAVLKALVASRATSQPTASFVQLRGRL